MVCRTTCTEPAVNPVLRTIFAAQFGTMLRRFYFILFAALTSLGLRASDHDGAHHGAEHAAHEASTHDAATADEDKAFDPNDVIMHHIKDSHGWHLFDWNDHPVSVPLPVILWTNDGLVVFSSAEFHHDVTGTHEVVRGNQSFVNEHEHIYYAGTHEGPLDLSITKNVMSLFVAALIILLIFVSTGRFYARNGAVAPKGLAGFMEPLVLFVRDEIARVNLPEKHVNRFLPFLLTVFFFIWVNNMLGLIPFFPGGANLTGNIAVTMTLAVITFLVTNFNGTKDYWLHVFWMPGVPSWLKPLIAVVEIIGLFTKPFSLMIRLFANITAGHILVLSLVSLIFIFKTVWVSPGAILLTLFISSLELLVAALQAFVFTMLTAMYIGTAVTSHDHHEHEGDHAHH